jgi:hypothetical protein
MAPDAVVPTARNASSRATRVCERVVECRAVGGERRREVARERPDRVGVACRGAADLDHGFTLSVVAAATTWFTAILHAAAGEVRADRLDELDADRVVTASILSLKRRQTA